MKRALAFVSSVALAGPIPAPGALIAGWENWVEVSADTWNPTQTGGGVTATAVGTNEAGGSWFNFSNATVANGASSDGTWGTVTLPGADTTVESSTDAVTLANGYDGWIDFTFTDTSGVATDLTSFHFDSGAFRARAATDWELSVLAGSDITVGSVATGGPVTVAAAPIVDDYDIDLTGLSDSRLDASGTVTLRLSFTGGAAPETGSSGHHLFLDNVALFGTPVPETSALALVAVFAGGLLSARRRR
jgi:hypothetical protein